MSRGKRSPEKTLQRMKEEEKKYDDTIAEIYLKQPLGIKAISKLTGVSPGKIERSIKRITERLGVEYVNQARRHFQKQVDWYGYRSRHNYHVNYEPKSKPVLCRGCGAKVYQPCVLCGLREQFDDYIK